MNVLRIILQILIIWLFYYAGVLIVEWTGVFIPPSIIGLVLLWVCLMLNIVKVKWIQNGAGFLISFLTLFFIPTTVGIIEYPELSTLAGVLLMLAVILSTLVTLFITGKTAQWIEKKETELEHRKQLIEKEEPIMELSMEQEVMQSDSASRDY